MQLLFTFIMDDVEFVLREKILVMLLDSAKDERTTHHQGDQMSM
jgi:hypothetical protein